MEKIKISPDMCTYNSEDDKKLVFEISIPGVEGNYTRYIRISPHLE